MRGHAWTPALVLFWHVNEANNCVGWETGYYWDRRPWRNSLSKMWGWGLSWDDTPSLGLLCCFCMLCGKRWLLDTLGLLHYLETNENFQIMSGNRMPHIRPGADYHNRGEGLLASRRVNNKGRWQGPFPDEDRPTMPSHSQCPLSFLFAWLWLDKLTLTMAVSKKNRLKRSHGGHLICQL